MRFSLYGETCKAGPTIEQILEIGRDGSLMARAEDSGSEGCYVEIARWNSEANEWQRFAFLKCFGREDIAYTLRLQGRTDDGTIKPYGDATDCAWSTAERIVDGINQQCKNRHQPIIHHMHDYKGVA